MKNELNQKTRRSTKFAVIVMRQEDKVAVRQFFETPLIFSVQEAKGLEYENVILVNFISNERAVFSDIADGVKASDLEGALKYMRAPDKTDKSLEVYKFFVNSLYVAITRAVKNIYLIEKDVEHPLIKLLGVNDSQDAGAVEQNSQHYRSGSQKPANWNFREGKNRLIISGRDVLRIQPVPWHVCTTERVAELLDRAPGQKQCLSKA